MVRGFEMLAILCVAVASYGGLAAGLHRRTGVDEVGNWSSRGRSRPRGQVRLRGFPPDAGAMRFQPLGLSMVRPYVAGKVPVVFVHGLWGSPRNWAGIIGALEADPFLSERYQCLTFGYTGGSSITYSAHQLRRELQSLRDRLDRRPRGTTRGIARS